MRVALKAGLQSPSVQKKWSNLGGVDGFGQDNTGGESDKGCEIALCFLAAQRSATRLKRLNFPTACSMRAIPFGNTW
jgi:hypothetical protein